MTPAERIEVAAVMFDDGIQMVESGIRARHPDYNERQIRQASLRLRLGRDVYERVWPDENAPQP